MNIKSIPAFTLLVNCGSVLIAILLGGCSVTQNKNDNSVYAEASEHYEIESMGQQLQSELTAYPTRFMIPVGEGKPTLERALFFFKSYTSAFNPVKPAVAARNIEFTNEKSRDPIKYRVARTLTREGFRYSVSAAAPGGPRRSELAAANLARFIREGQLEISLVQSSK